MSLNVERGSCRGLIDCHPERRRVSPTTMTRSVAHPRRSWGIYWRPALADDLHEKGLFSTAGRRPLDVSSSSSFDKPTRLRTSALPISLGASGTDCWDSVPLDLGSDEQGPRDA